MSYDLAICRFGGLAEFEGLKNGQATLTLGEGLEQVFARQRKAICEHPRYGDSLRAIEKVAGTTFQPQDGPFDSEAEFSIFTMPSIVDVLFEDDEEQSSHLVGLLPPERMTVSIDNRQWNVRARASVTACALEVTNGLPKVWWTFEGVPSDPSPDTRPTENETIAFLSLARALETPALDHLTAAYFGGLQETLESKSPFDYALGDDRVRIRFADNNDAGYEALIDAMRYRGLNPAAIDDATSGRLETAKRGLQEFRHFVQDSNPPDGPGIDPNEAYVNSKVRVLGVDAVSARRECQKSQSISIAGVAQRPGSRTAFDKLDIVRDQRIAENEDKTIRFFSAARRLTRHLAGIEALRLEQRRRRPGVDIAPII